MKLLDVVALIEDMPEKHLQCGQVGTIVEILASSVFEVEFCDLDVRTYATVAIPENKLLVLHHDNLKGEPRKWVNEVARPILFLSVGTRMKSHG